MTRVTWSGATQDAGLSGSAGRGEGDRYLELTSALDIEVRAYALSADGALFELLETAARNGDRFRIATFDPGDDAGRAGLLRLVNPSRETVVANVRGTDDLGVSPGAGVTIELPARMATTYLAAELESGAAPGLSGSLGDGSGRWRLDGEVAVSVLAMSLIEGPDGRLANLSHGPVRERGGAHRVPLFPSASDSLGREDWSG